MDAEKEKKIKAELTFINIINPKTGRTSSLAIGGNRPPAPQCLRVVGGLEHGAEITFTTVGAKILLEFLIENILSKREENQK